MGNIQETCCNPEPERSSSNNRKSSHNSKAIVDKHSPSKKPQSPTNFGDNAFTNLFKSKSSPGNQANLDKDQLQDQKNERFEVFSNDAIKQKRVKLTSLVSVSRPKLNSITIGFSRHAHNFPLTGISASGPTHKQKHQQHIKKRKKLHSMKPPPLLEALEEKGNVSEDAKSNDDRIEVR